jgi:dTDP-4-amino-4,6-dideoxygalactose transaminase
MKIPFCELIPSPEHQREYTEAAARVLASGRYINGPEVVQFEKETAQFLGASFAVGLNSGTDALLIALQSLGVGPGDEVITTPFTFFATAEVIARLGATPVFADIDIDSFCISAQEVERCITPKTKAILPVHLFGHAAPMDELQSLARQYGLSLLEDAAQAFGGYHQEKRLGAIGDVSAFSLFPTKNLGGFGDGGLLVTNREEIATRARSLRAHGMKQKFLPEELGYNSRLDELQASFLRIKLRSLDEQNQKRRRAASLYRERLQRTPGVVPPTEKNNTTHVYHLYTVRITDGRRDEVQRTLTAQGVEVGVYYPKAMHQLGLFENRAPLPNAERAVNEALSLPLWPDITPAAQERVVDVLRAALR